MESKQVIVSERNRDIYKAYRRILKNIDAKNVPLCRIMQMVCDSPAPRFYISIEQARRYVKAIEQGRNTGLKGCKAQMCQDLYDAYVSRRSSMPGYYKNAVLMTVVHSQAKSFYISPGRAYRILFPNKS